MSQLRALQRAFQYRTLRGSRFQSAMALAGDAADDRFLIYRRAYFSRLLDALADHYEALRAFLGEARFRALALAYITHFPSRHRNIRWFGSSLPAFASSHAPWTGEPWISDLARFEWNLTIAFDAADVPAITKEDISAIPSHLWHAAVFRVHPSVRIVHLHTNAPQLRSAFEAGGARPDPETFPEVQSWVLWRQGDVVRFRSLAAIECAALTALRRGRPFPEVCAAATGLGSVDEAAGHVAVWLRTWVHDSLIADVSVDSRLTNKLSVGYSGESG